MFGGLLLVAVIAYLMLIHDFLAVNEPVRAEILIVEGWIWARPVMHEVVEEFQRGKYQCVVCVGGPGKVAGESYANLAARRLIQLGMDTQAVHVLPVSDAERHRTFGAALAVRNWLKTEKPEVRAVNVLTLGVHARKSWVIFRKAFQPGVDVGIIAGTESDYPVQTWWISPTGIYLVLRNTMGYLYALAWSPLSEQPRQ